ncbi:phosphoenolpyruvate-protein phosphotransferase [bacterium BMS3Abin14]|nr:phosphoenolpyruvate-protein phosphotransferase [bacterium BMS3Abin14]
MCPTRDQISLLEQISRLIGESHDFRGTVDNIVSLVKREMHTDVCSLYLYNDERDHLALAATEGLSRSAIGKVKMRPSEGLTGLVFETRTPLVVQNADKHPRFRYFPITKEEHYHTFLGVPLISRRNPIGVLVVQDKGERSYTKQELQLFNTIAGQVAGVVVNARLLNGLSMDAAAPKPVAEIAHQSRLLHGIPAAPGIAMGTAIILEGPDDFHYLMEKHSDDPEQERKFLDNAVAEARTEIEKLQRRVHEQLGEEDAAIFNIHLMMIEDQGFTQKVDDLISSGYTALYSVKTVVSDYLNSFDNINDPYLRERGVDIEDVGRRLGRLLSGSGSEDAMFIEKAGILVSRLITPSDAASLAGQKVEGVATAGGGHTSHAIILSRSMGIPCVVGIDEILDIVHSGDFLIVDGNMGTVFVNPDESIVREYRRLTEDYNRHVVELVSERDLPAVTLDGYRVELMGNVGLLSDLKLTSFYGAEGIGLYRTELPFIARNVLPGEDDQYRIYRRMVEGSMGKPVTIRTLDVGGDKNIPYLKMPKEDNPFLGWRSIRMCLEKVDIFKVQIRAILRAAIHGSVNIMIPMISSMEEIRRVKILIEESIRELEVSRVPHDPGVPVGIMIEIPAAVHLADRLAKEVDFFSIGTNDLTQYALAVDRNNPKVAHLYDPMNPAVLSLIQMTTKAARDNGIPVGVCGEIAALPLWTPLLLGLGVTDLSMNAAAIPLVKRSIRLIKHQDCVRAARRALKVGTSSEVRRILSRFETMIKTQVYFSPSEGKS